MSTSLRNLLYWLHRNLSSWQLPLYPVTKISYYVPKMYKIHGLYFICAVLFKETCRYVVVTWYADWYCIFTYEIVLSCQRNVSCTHYKITLNKRKGHIYIGQYELYLCMFVFRGGGIAKTIKTSGMLVLLTWRSFVKSLKKSLISLVFT